MRRIIIDSQSNSLLCGSKLEQRYDQRGGLCQVGAGHLVLTCDPVDGDFLRYWRGLGFALPELVAVGPCDPGCTLSDAVLGDRGAREAVRRVARGGDARLEFFCIEEPERRLADELGIPAYCNFDVSLPLGGKIAFKNLCNDLGLPTVPWAGGGGPDEAAAAGRSLLAEGGEVMVKTDRGMGGAGCGGMARVGDEAGLERAVARLSGLGMDLFVETAVEPLCKEFSVHWEMGPDGALERVLFFDTITKDSSYRGTASPLFGGEGFAEKVRRSLLDVLVPYLARRGGRGFYCCDIVVGADGVPRWNDFNPRKGASIYVHDMVQRLARNRAMGPYPAFWHEGVRLPGSEGLAVADVLKRLEGLTAPNADAFVVLTNPGVVPFGRVDLTGISLASRNAAHEAFLAARERLRS